MNNAHIFGLGNFFGLTLQHSIMTLLQMFMQPYAHLLPIRVSYPNSLSLSQSDCILQVNGFYTFLIHQASKEMIFHIVFRTTTTNRIHLTVADLEPATFRHAAHLPVDLLALVGLCVSAPYYIGVLLAFITTLVLPIAPYKASEHLEYREHHATVSPCEPSPQ
jgi:hypothetical protein